MYYGETNILLVRSIYNSRRIFSIDIVVIIIIIKFCLFWSLSPTQGGPVRSTLTCLSLSADEVNLESCQSLTDVIWSTISNHFTPGEPRLIDLQG